MRLGYHQSGEAEPEREVWEETIRDLPEHFLSCSDSSSAVVKIENLKSIGH